MSDSLQPSGPDIASVELAEDGSFVTEWSDSDEVTLSPSLEQSIVTFQRAKSLALHGVLKRKRRLWPTPRI